MPFRFPLESLLHLRKSIEHQQEMRLRAANQQVAKVRHLIQQCEEQRVHLHRDAAQQLQSGMMAAELHFENACATAIHQDQEHLERELVRLQNLRDQQQRIYQHARREREIFDNLREKQAAEYKQQTARRDQRRQDDLQLLRRFLSSPDQINNR